MSELRAAQPGVEIEVIEILADPLRALRDGVCMVPAILIGRRRWYHVPPLADLEATLREED